MSTSALDAPAQQKLADLIKDIGVAMLTTVGSDGSLRSRPMGCPKHNYDGALWFFTSRAAPKVLELSADNRVNVALSEPKNERYVSLSGRVSLVVDPERARAMWSPLLKSWFPGGLEDPDLALLRIDVDHAEYWDAKGSKMLVFFSLVRAAATGKAPQHLGEHRQLS